MRELGEYLMQERLKKGFSLVQMQEATKIRLRYLEAIESGEFGVVPAEVYLKGFIRTYAEALGLDGWQVLDLYKRMKAPVRSPRDSQEPDRKPAPHRVPPAPPVHPAALVPVPTAPTARTTTAAAAPSAAAGRSDPKGKRAFAQGEQRSGLLGGSERRWTERSKARRARLRRQRITAFAAVLIVLGGVLAARDFSIRRRPPGATSIPGASITAPAGEPGRAGGPNDVAGPSGSPGSPDLEVPDEALFPEQPDPNDVKDSDGPVSREPPEGSQGTQASSLPPGLPAVPETDAVTVGPEKTVPAQTGSSLSSAVSAATDASRDGLTLTLEAVERCWIDLRVDKRRVFVGILNPGDVRTWKAEELIQVKFGRPEGVIVRLNGKNLGRAGTGVTQREFTLSMLEPGSGAQ